MKKEIIFYYTGRVERWSPSKRNYVWHDGYSENSSGQSYPWLTMEECRELAKEKGASAIFKKR